MKIPHKKRLKKKRFDDWLQQQQRRKVIQRLQGFTQKIDENFANYFLKPKAKTSAL